MKKNKGFRLTTINSYDFFECSSALQKSIRRCDEAEAMFWALELYQSNYGKYLWKRIIIMASEDVGLGDPDIITRIMALKQAYDFLVEKKDKHRPERLPFFHAVISLANAKKSRYVDLSISIYENEHRKNAGKHQIPDYALDIHTRRGKKMGRGLDHFYQEGAMVNNPNKMPDEKRFERLAKIADKEIAEYEKNHSMGNLSQSHQPEKQVYKIGSPYHGQGSMFNPE